MPPLLTSDIVERPERPAVNRSPHRMVPVISKPPPPKGRMYGDEPLAYKPSEIAPKKATIKERIALPDSVSYTLDLAGVEIEDVGIHEVLEYVSAYDLEKFENRQFEEEREIMRIAKLEREAEREARKQRAKTKRIVVYQSESDEESDEEEEVETGRHGRARPTYTQFYKVPDPKAVKGAKEPKVRQRKRRRKRNPVTGELMPLSDPEDEAFVAPSKALKVPVASPAASPRPPAAPVAELPKRRRRKRDPATGELLPLSPVQPSSEIKKRPRRRRHPITGELMPLGWRYDPDADQKSPKVTRNDGSIDRVPSINRLTIGREHEAKRLKLTSEEPSSDDELSTKQPLAKFLGKEISESDDLQSSSSREPPVSNSKSKQTPKTSVLRPTPQSKSRLRPPSSTGDSSSGPQITLASFLEASKRNDDGESSSDESSSTADQKKINTPADRGKTSIMNPMAAQTEDESEADDDDDLEEGEWFVEAVLDHRVSDPRSHPGRKQTTLYKTKWEGWDEPTWEPITSFVDQSVIDVYRKRVGLDRPSKPPKPQAAPEPEKKSATPAPKSKITTIVLDESDEEDEEDEEGYEVEAILAHHMSDPRTHPGKPSTMLYKVKWLGWKDTTWEPRRSFIDKTLVRQYEKRVGMDVESEDSDDDVEMKT